MTDPRPITDAPERSSLRLRPDPRTTLNGPWCDADVIDDYGGIEIPWGPCAGQILIHLPYEPRVSW